MPTAYRALNLPVTLNTRKPCSGSELTELKTKIWCHCATWRLDQNLENNSDPYGRVLLQSRISKKKKGIMKNQASVFPMSNISSFGDYTEMLYVSLGCGHGYMIVSVQIHKSGTHLKEGEFYCLQIMLIHQLFKVPTGLTGKSHRQPLPAPPIWGSNAGSLSVRRLLQRDRCDQPTPTPTFS